MKHYDYIILGTGTAGLQLAYYMVQDDFFTDKSILLIDKSEKKKNDRTWCFWEIGHGDFDNIVYQSWDTIVVTDDSLNQGSQIHPYRYKMIKGIDFYNFVIGHLKTFKNVTIIKEEILSYNDNGTNITVNTASRTYEASIGFNSLYDAELVSNQKKFPLIQQHFMGWYIKTSNPCFNDKKVTFMDFSVPQNGNTRFMYVLPVSTTEALVEYTLFSEALLDKEAYEREIITYLKKKGIEDYQIIEKEKGTIPMTAYPFHRLSSKNILHIGTAGGWTKASTGFTFKNTNNKIKELIPYIKREKDLSKFYKKNRFRNYDMLLLDVLHKKNSLGAYIFTSLFKKNRPQIILKFLEERTNFREELKIISSIVHIEFIKAFLKRISFR